MRVRIACFILLLFSLPVQVLADGKNVTPAELRKALENLKVENLKVEERLSEKHTRQPPRISELERWRVRGDETKLETLAEGLLDQFDGMPSVPIIILDSKSSDLIIDGEVVWAFYSPSHHLIAFNNDFYRNASSDQLENTMKHELVHAWVDWRKLPGVHSEDFYKKASKVGLHLGAVSSKSSFLETIGSITVGTFMGLGLLVGMAFILRDGLRNGFSIRTLVFSSTLVFGAFCAFMLIRSLI